MDKRVIFAVAGSGKTTYIVNSLTPDKRFLIVTYTNSNYDNLTKKIIEKNHGVWPNNVVLMRYFPFLYRFCYKPFLADRCKAKGVFYGTNNNRRISQNQREYYFTPTGYFYSNRLSLFLEKAHQIDAIKMRIETYFDSFIIDEVQDIAGRDFSFLEQLMSANVNMLFVGDFYQHTYNTSLDGNANKSLFDDRVKYEKRFRDQGLTIDTSTLLNSWRCSKTVCDYISANLGISIQSNSTDDSIVRFITDKEEANRILNDDRIVKLHYQNSHRFGNFHRNWGDTKGEDCYLDVCVMLNKETLKKYKAGKLFELAPSTRNKLYVAITRAHRNVYLLEE